MPSAVIDEDVLRYERVKKKAYVRIVTTKGPINLELHSDMVRLHSPKFIPILSCSRVNDEVMIVLMFWMILAVVMYFLAQCYVYEYIVI